MSNDKVKALEVKRGSRLSGFYRQSPERRRARLVEARLVPMAVEEPSIVAAASYAARLCSEGGRR